MSRDALVGLLWPEVDEARARAALSQALYALKRDTGEDELVLGHDVLTLNSDVLRTDVSEFEHAIDRGEFEAAANLYSGPFFAGVFISEAVDFEHWLDGVRLRLSHAAEQALEHLAMDAQTSTERASSLNLCIRRRLAAIASTDRVENWIRCLSLTVDVLLTFRCQPLDEPSLPCFGRAPPVLRARGGDSMSTKRPTELLIRLTQVLPDSLALEFDIVAF